MSKKILVIIIIATAFLAILFFGTKNYTKAQRSGSITSGPKMTSVSIGCNSATVNWTLATPSSAVKKQSLWGGVNTMGTNTKLRDLRQDNNVPLSQTQFTISNLAPNQWVYIYISNEDSTYRWSSNYMAFQTRDCSGGKVEFSGYDLGCNFANLHPTGSTASNPNLILEWFRSPSGINQSKFEYPSTQDFTLSNLEYHSPNPLNSTDYIYYVYLEMSPFVSAHTNVHFETTCNEFTPEVISSTTIATSTRSIPVISPSILPLTPTGGSQPIQSPASQRADFNNDGKVDLLDFNIWRTGFLSGF